MEINEIRALLGSDEIGQIAKRYLSKSLREHPKAYPELPLLFKGPKSQLAIQRIVDALQGEGLPVARGSAVLNDQIVWVLKVADGNGELTAQGLSLPDPEPMENPYAYQEGMTIFDFPGYESGMSRGDRAYLEKRLPRMQKFDPESYADYKKLLELDDAARAARDPRHKYLPEDKAAPGAAAVKAAPALTLPPPEPPPKKRRPRAGKAAGGKGGGALPSITIQG